MGCGTGLFILTIDDFVLFTHADYTVKVMVLTLLKRFHCLWSPALCRGFVCNLLHAVFSCNTLQ